MKVGIITRPNQKGQIVIPKEMRDRLGINSRVPLNLILSGKGIYIYPIEEVITKAEKESSYLELLKKTQGAWKGEDWRLLRKKRKEIELAGSQERKESW